MKKEESTRKTYDKVADLWESYRQTPEEEIKILLKEYRNKKILDIGCGSGRYLKSFDVTNYVVELDYSKSMLKLNPHDKKVLADVSNLPFREDTFDFVLGVAVLHHFDYKTLPSVLDKIYQILKKEGRGLFTFWFKPELINKEGVNIPWRKEGKDYPRYYYFYSLDSIKQVLAASKFSKGKLYIDKKGKNIIVEVKK